MDKPARPRLPAPFSNRALALHRDADDTLAGWQRFAEEHPEAIVRAEAELQRRRWQPAEASWTYVVTDDNGQRREVSRAEHARILSERTTSTVTADWQDIATNTPTPKPKPRTPERPTMSRSKPVAPPIPVHDPVALGRALAAKVLAEEAKLRAQQTEDDTRLALQMGLDPRALAAHRAEVEAKRRDPNLAKTITEMAKLTGTTPEKIAKHRVVMVEQVTKHNGTPPHDPKDKGAPWAKGWGK
jgi:hypothetical protein